MNEAVFQDDKRFLLVCVNRTYGAIGLYNAARYSWKINPENVKGRYVIAVVNGVIEGLFEADEWLPAVKKNFPDIPDDHGNWENQDGRFGFTGWPVTKYLAQSYVGKKIPPQLRFKGNPVRYIN
jgi:hypothetical protein